MKSPPDFTDDAFYGNPTNLIYENRAPISVATPSGEDENDYIILKPISSSKKKAVVEKPGPKQKIKYQSLFMRLIDKQRRLRSEK